MQSTQYLQHSTQQCCSLVLQKRLYADTCPTICLTQSSATCRTNDMLPPVT
jgi:hypothetical protein